MTEWAEKTEKLMQEELGRLEVNLKKIRGNQISLEAVEELFIEQQGKGQKIKHLATLKVNSGQLVVQVFEPKKIPAISKAISEAQQLGYRQVKKEKNELYFSLVPMTGEIRQQLVKEVNKIIEEGKIRLQNSRREVLKKIHFNEKKQVEKEVDRVKDKYLLEIQKLWERKKKELSL